MSNTNNVLGINPDNVWSFEFKTSNPDFQYHVEVLQTHRHHFTGELMRYVRMDHIGFGKAESFFDYLNEKEWADILSKRTVG